MPKGFQKGNKLATVNKGEKHKKTLEAEAARELLRQRVFAEMDDIISAQIDSAKGHWVADDKGKVYMKSPDKGSAELLLNHAIGKPKDTVDVIGEIKIDIDIKKTIDKVYGDSD